MSNINPEEEHWLYLLYCISNAKRLLLQIQILVKHRLVLLYYIPRPSHQPYPYPTCSPSCARP